MNNEQFLCHSGNMSLSSSSASVGSAWSNLLHFYCDNDIISVSHETLPQDMEVLIDTSEKIKVIYVYQSKLNELQLTANLLYHEFLVIETEKWLVFDCCINNGRNSWFQKWSFLRIFWRFWSLEKNAAGIILQRSKDEAKVRDICEKDRRLDIRLWKKASGKGYMKDLVDFIYSRNELKKKYDILGSNCQDFAAKICNNFCNDGAIQYFTDNRETVVCVTVGLIAMSLILYLYLQSSRSKSKTK